MKLNPDFIMQEMEAGVSVLVPTGDSSQSFHGIVRLNESAAFIVSKLASDTTEEAIVEALGKEYEGTTEEFTASVRATVEKLREVGALVE